jgi:hypothetical protein
VLSYLDYRNLLPDEKNLSELIDIISHLNSNTRTPINCEFTPVELDKSGRSLSADTIVFEKGGNLPLNVINPAPLN